MLEISANKTANDTWKYICLELDLKHKIYILDNMLSKEDFIIEFRGIVYLLIEHSFLKYSSNLIEYEQKEKTAAAEFLSLVHKRTGIMEAGYFSNVNNVL